MRQKCRIFAQFGSSIALILSFGLALVQAQDPTLDEIKYNEDYTRMQSILKTTDVVKRADKMAAMYRDRPDMREDLRKYIDSLFTKDLEKMLKEQKYAEASTIAEKAVKVRPRFGEVYFFQGMGLKNQKKTQEAMTAFARCWVIQPNAFRLKAKQQLDSLYRASNNGSLVGQDKLIKEAMKGLR